ncbi:prolactin regulatory element-binding protein-like [Ornithodoros turicata]|uniref:prolactin regulatory element-binding protein-like n=1 Tax=Ornithodoros turicata TaxID=34597 RepID=UPI00313A4602
MAPSRSGELLARVNFPLYSLNVLTERHIIVAGGGGSSKTGIQNKIEVYELVPSGHSCRAEPVTRHLTGNRAIMNSTVFFHKGKKHFALAAGTDEHCQIYQMKYCLRDEIAEDDNVHHEENGIEKNGPTGIRRRRKTTSTSSDRGDGEVMNGITPKEGAESQRRSSYPKTTDSNANSVRIGFSIQPVTSFQTDFSPKDEPFQKVVRFAPSIEVLFTGGADGYLRAWKYPDFTMQYEVKAHEDELDDLCINPLENKVVTVSRDGHGYVWDTSDGSLVSELTCNFPSKSAEKYVFRACRFGVVEGKRENHRLFTISNPAVRKQHPPHTYLVKWDTRKFLPEKLQSTGTDMLSSLAISEDGRFVGVGKISGTVEVYIAFSLQRLYRAECAHNIFVTGLEFLKSCDETRRLTGNHDASLISISVDNHIVAHHIPFPATMGLMGLVLMFIGVLFLVYILMDFLGL